MKILIAEDEMVSRVKISKMMNTLGILTVFDNGSDAYSAFLEEHRKLKPFALVILDVSMPDMSGVEVLKKIRTYEDSIGLKQEYRTKVLMLTSCSDRKTVISCFQSGCSDYMVKPFKVSVIEEKLSKLGFTFKGAGKNIDGKSVKLMVSRVAEEYKRKDADLLSLNPAVLALHDYMEKKDFSEAGIAKIIEEGISGKFISAANSPFYRGPEKTENVKAAVKRLGAGTAVSLVSAVAVRELYSTENPLIQKTMDEFWLHTLAAAHCAKIIAEQLLLPGPEKLFIKGLLHDVGAAVLFKHIGDNVSENTVLNRRELTGSVFDIHGSFGAAVLKKWGFGDDFAAVAGQHEFKSFDRSAPRQVLIVYLADILSFKAGYGFFDKEVPDVEHTGPARILGLKLRELEGIAEAAADIVQRSSSSFRV